MDGWWKYAGDELSCYEMAMVLDKVNEEPQLMVDERKKGRLVIKFELMKWMGRDLKLCSFDLFRGQIEVVTLTLYYLLYSVDLRVDVL